MLMKDASKLGPSLEEEDWVSIKHMIQEVRFFMHENTVLNLIRAGRAPGGFLTASSGPEPGEGAVVSSASTPARG